MAWHVKRSVREVSDGDYSKLYEREIKRERVLFAASAILVVSWATAIIKLAAGELLKKAYCRIRTEEISYVILLLWKESF